MRGYIIAQVKRAAYICCSLGAPVVSQRDTIKALKNRSETKPLPLTFHLSVCLCVYASFFHHAIGDQWSVWKWKQERAHINRGPHFNVQLCIAVCFWLWRCLFCPPRLMLSVGRFKDESSSNAFTILHRACVCTSLVHFHALHTGTTWTRN